MSLLTIVEHAKFKNITSVLNATLAPRALYTGVRRKTRIAWIPCYHVLMIASFKDGATEDLFNGINSKRARSACPRSLWKGATRKLDQLDSVQSLDELKVPPGNRFERLRGNRRGQYSIRINEQYRICFLWDETGPEDVEITDYH